jgi:hypothetical protein
MISIFVLFAILVLGNCSQIFKASLDDTVAGAGVTGYFEMELKGSIYFFYLSSLWKYNCRL